MRNELLLFSSLMLIVGAIIFVVYLYQSGHKKNIAKYIKNDKKKSNSKKIIKDFLDIIVPSSIVMNDREISDKIVSAGYYTFQYAHLYLPIKYVLLVLGAIVLVLISYSSYSSMTIVAIVASWTVIVLIIPDAILATRIKAYRSHVSKQLPYIIDLLAVCVQTGMTIEASLSYLAKEMESFEPKSSLLLKRLNDRAAIVGMNEALEELYSHIPTSEMRSFVMTLKQSLQYGASIYQTLTVLSADIRKVSMLLVEERIGKLAAKMSVPLILFIMMPIVILITVPGILRLMSGA
ncbi:biotin synthase [Vibrio ponticus]|uniref:Biotin synthase n=1 Tax=Vibrio ponticus TaxID=265668 RepID=A0ABX3FII5_9VIBR|nr:type II secretion system F family protein [Vibrio ponticus]OLQ93986.1 biotin synthase [Vibrio ponticus]